MKRKQQEGKYSYLVKNTILFSISSFGSKLLTFLLVPLYTSILSTSEYGVADLIITTSNVLVYVLTIEISSSVLRFAIERKSKQGEILSYGLKIVSIGVAALTLLLFVLYRINILQVESYFYLFLLLYFLGQSFYTLLTSYLRAIDKVKEVAVSGLLSTVIMLGGNILALVVLKTGVIGYLVSLVSGSIVSSLYLAFVIWKSKTYSLSDRCDPSTKKQMRAYSIPLIFNGVCWWINNSLDKYFILWMLGTTENGIYAAALKIPTVIALLQSVFQQAWNLSAIKEYDKEDKSGFFSNIYNFYNCLLTVSTSILVLLTVFISRFMLQKDFFIAWGSSSVLLLSSLFNALAGFWGSIFTAVKNSKIFARSAIVSALVNICMNYVLIQIWQTEGAAAATVISFFVMWLIRMYGVRKYITLKMNIARDIACYVLLAVQVGVLHLPGHGYVLQALILALILILHFQTLKGLVSQMLEKVKKAFSSH